MTQQPRKPLKPLIDLPDAAVDVERYVRSSMTAACGGHDGMGDVLNFFLYKATGVAQGIENAETLEFIRVECTLDDITTPTGLSKKCLIAHIKQLETWGYVKAYGYQHTYDVYFHEIAAALKNPPEHLPKKPRGKHAYTHLTLEEKIVFLQSKQEQMAQEIVKIQSEIVKIQSEMLTLQSPIVKIQSEMLTLQSPKSDEAAPELEEVSNFEALESRELQESLEGEERARAREAPLSYSHLPSPPESVVATGNAEVALEEVRQAEPEPEQEAQSVPVAPSPPGESQPTQEEDTSPAPKMDTESEKRRTPPSQNKTHEPPKYKNPIKPMRLEGIDRQFKMPARLFVDTTRKEAEVPEPRPLSPKEQRRLDEAAIEAYWTLAEDILGTPFSYTVREKPPNKNGLAGLVADRVYSILDVETGLRALDGFSLQNGFTWEKFHLILPGLLASKSKNRQKGGNGQTPSMRSIEHFQSDPQISIQPVHFDS